MKQLQFIGVSPDDLKSAILSEIKTELKELKKEFQPKEPTEYLTRNEVRDLLKVDLSTIWNWQRKGKLKAYGIGNRVYYRRDEVEAAMKPLN